MMGRISSWNLKIPWISSTLLFLRPSKILRQVSGGVDLRASKSVFSMRRSDRQDGQV
jgi:hypothetical protein